jgi:hypothetical protein
MKGQHWSGEEARWYGGGDGAGLALDPFLTALAHGRAVLEWGWRGFEVMVVRWTPSWPGVARPSTPEGSG